MDAGIIIAAISGIVSVIVAIINNTKLNRNSSESKMFNAKQSILQMVDSDYLAVEVRGKMPSNHSRILYEYDIYVKNGGNSDVTEIIEEYKKWYKELEIKED